MQIKVWWKDHIQRIRREIAEERKRSSVRKKKTDQQSREDDMRHERQSSGVVTKMEGGDLNNLSAESGIRSVQEDSRLSQKNVQMDSNLFH